MTLRFTNSLGGDKAPFVARDPERVTLYVCGPTVYDYAHLGNARPAVVFDVLARLLRTQFHRVVYARNITDIDDKINAAAARQGVPIEAITNRFTDAYREDMASIGCLPPDLEPRVTTHVPAILDLVERLIARGHAYAADGHVLFHVPSFPAYGRLSGRSLEDMIAGARVEVAPFKKHPADFVLWKPSTDDQPGWDSPWGRGRPGWHIECSAMIECQMGAGIDIHGGGADLIFPHHENEIAQGTAARDDPAPYAGLWLHNGMVTVEGAKMAKSAGNMITVRSALERWPGEALRLVLLSAQYRQPVDWSEAAAARAVRTLERLYAALALAGPADPAAPLDPEALASVEAALQDDLAFPRALAAMAALAKRIRAANPGPERQRLGAALRAAGKLVGLLEQPDRWQADTQGDGGDMASDAEVAALIDERASARAAGHWDQADRIRDRLAALDIRLIDDGGTTRWVRKLETLA
ncbi:cysteine--tRNA ligase [Sandaracinobacteroides hominis]|uniref:cysteine--tRNA ligase n=1 Tax=Sandaracinobacteroides hominis TaxID=2780086 RepID=UPI0018F3D4D7|nr:cysteine--tRNA ligase [Sandaracinobacteroides hominis]